MTHQLRNHGQGLIREILTDERLFAGKGFGGTAGGLPLIVFV